MPWESVTDGELRQFERSYVDSMYLFVVIAHAALAVRTFRAEDITAAAEGDSGIIAL